MRIILALIALLLVSAPASAEHRGWHGGGGWHGHGGGGGESGFLGGILGGLIGSLFAPPVVVEPPYTYPSVPEMAPGTPQWQAYCFAKYRSFNPVTGTYTGFDGQQHACQ